ncbi:uncharacterized protein FA14DRAFT_180080 [Meira miltonrushii]|uniref:Velvet domain-containing protein n=1 Tax=Meira miltonrushii TaxID=1280837 RepID=A0A316V893_9BASI|nr:uncharacterized protein FA14DRAFT_180080 [Meira miltonrushii]PWN33434.1 hypothetical protein FA14DRAFT_180080 [Meira miltonrushii]
MNSINKQRKSTSSSNSSNSNGSIHENTPSAIEDIKSRNLSKSEWSFEAPIPSTSLPRSHLQDSNPIDYARYAYANKRTSLLSTHSSESSDYYLYPSHRSSSLYTYRQAGFTDPDNVVRSQRGHSDQYPQNRNHQTVITNTEVTVSTAQEAPAPLFDPFILMDNKVEPRTYNLIIRQSPMHGQMCTLGSKERRILDPLPIIQLDIRDRNGKRDLIGQSSPLLIMQVNLIAEHIEVGSGGKSSDRNESGSASNSPVEVRQNLSPISASGATSTRVGLPGFASFIDSTMATNIDQSAPTKSDLDSQLLPKPHETHFSALRLLEGKLTASPHIVKDIENHLDMKERVGSDPQKRQKVERDPDSLNPKRRSSMPVHSSTASIKESADVSEERQEDQKACFFIFTDLSIRLRGTYRLQFSLIKLGLPSPTSTTKSTGQIVARTISDPFPIHHTRDFAGMTESTPLAKSLAGQGVHIPIRNDSRWKSRVQQPSQMRANQIQQEHKTTSSTDGSPSSASLTPARSSSTPQSNIKSQQ